MTDIQETPTSSPPGERPDALQPWQLFTLAGLIGATIVVFMSRGQTPAGIILLSLIIFAAALVGLAALRTFLPFAEKILEGGPEVLGGRTRSVLEREKGLLLRFIKELEFDRRMGKVSERDFAEMSARLRSRAARVMRQLDAGSLYREQIEREVRRRLGNRDAGVGTRDSKPSAGDSRPAERETAVAEPEPRAPEIPVSESVAPIRESRVPYPESRVTDPESRVADPESRVPDPEFRVPDPESRCPSCETRNDSDARFCKSCGTRLETAS